MHIYICVCIIYIYIYTHIYIWGFPAGWDGKESACNAGDLGLIAGWGISPGEGNDNPLQWDIYIYKTQYM